MFRRYVRCGLSAVPDSTRIVIDVNLWVSAAISRSVAQQIRAILLQDHIEIIACDELLDEFEKTLYKPKLQKYVTPERIQIALELVKESTTLFRPESKVALCRDGKDDYLLALAKDAQASYLLTGDKDLLVLKHFQETQILSISEYMASR